MWCYMLALTWGTLCYRRARQLEAGNTPPRDNRSKPKWNSSNKGQPGLERRWALTAACQCPFLVTPVFERRFHMIQLSWSRLILT